MRKIGILLLLASSVEAQSAGQESLSPRMPPPSRPTTEASTARETPTSARCKATFAARVADARGALVAYRKYRRRFDRAQPAVAWFRAHCRFLDELERVIRELDDPYAFVCDPSVRGRPEGLTARLVLQYETEEPISSFQRFAEADRACVELDGRDRISLVLDGVPEVEARKRVFSFEG